MTLHPNVASVLRSADLMLEMARTGWTDYQSAGERRYAGLLNAITTARSVTNVLQNLKHLAPGFSEWWQREVQILNNPTARWFVELRNYIEKQGTVGASGVSLHIEYLDTGELARLAPPGTISTFFGDQLGRNGWEVQLPDGTTQTVYFKLPDAVARSVMHIEGAPDGRPIDELFPEYLAQIEHLVRAAHERFG